MPHVTQKQNLTTYYFQGMFYFLFIYTNTLKETDKACKRLITKLEKNPFQPEIKNYFLWSRFLRREGYPIQLKQTSLPKSINTSIYIYFQ